MPHFPRRQILSLGLAYGLGAGIGRADGPDSGILSFRLVEPSGRERVAEPVTTRLPGHFPPGRFRLHRDGRAIPAQFRAEDREGGSGMILDFAADLGPRTEARYEVHHGPSLEPGPEPLAGLALETTPDQFRILRNHEPAFQVDRHLAGLLASVGSGHVPWIRDDSLGAWLEMVSGETVRLGSPPLVALSSRVVRHGPAAVAIEFSGPVTGQVRTCWELIMTRSRQRVEVVGRVDDPGREVSAVGFSLNLIQANGSVVLERDPADTPQWARVRAGGRDVVVAVEPDSAETRRDLVQVGNSGELRVQRTRNRSASATGLHAWIEFASASTSFETRPSPEALLHPIRVVWDRTQPRPG